jgi:sugar/nucleoside kinase (ribokinase family)
VTAVPSVGRVVVIGPHILDVLGRPVDAIPPGQGSERLDEIRATAAGTAAGTAVDLAKLGASVATLGAVGTDLLGDIVLAAMARHGIDTSGVVRIPGVQTSATILPIRPNGERPALHVPGATRLFTAADLDVGRLAGCAAVVLGGPDALAGLSADDLGAVAAAACATGALLVIDVLHPGSARDLGRIGRALARASWFCPNYDQLLALTERHDVDRAVADVRTLGTGGVAVTLGADGCLVTDGIGLVHVPAIAADVVDTTGCGDAFTAGFLTGLLLRCAPVDAAWLGVACGSLVAAGLGSDAGLTDLDQAIRLVRTANDGVADRIDARRQIAEGKLVA